MPASSAGERLDLRCLGPLEVRRGATTLPISGARLRALLATSFHARITRFDRRARRRAHRRNAELLELDVGYPLVMAES